jgi:TP901 family phage tail tape measure protein
MASKYSIDAVFSLIDNLTKPLDRIAGQGNAVGDALKGSFARAQKRVDDFGQNIDKITGALRKASIAAVGAGVAAAGAFTIKGIKNAVEYQSALAKVATLADTAQVPMSAMSEDILKLSSKMGVGVSELSESVYQAISAGVQTSQAVGMVEVATKAAVGGFTDTTTAIDGLTSVLNAYGMETSRATDIADQMLIAQNLGKTSFGEMAQTMGQVIPTASALNVSTKELFSSVATLTANAVPTSAAMTGLKATLSNIMKPSSNAAKMAQRLGLDFNAAALESKGFAQFMRDVGKAVNGDKEILGQLFGSVEAVNTVLALTGPGAALFEKSLAAMGDSAGAAEQAFNTMMDTPEKKFALLMNKITNIGIRLGTALLPVLQKIMDKAAVFVEKLEGLDFGPFVAQVEAAIDRIFADMDFNALAQNIGNFFTSIMNGVHIFTSLAETVWKLRTPIVAVVGAMSIFKGVMTTLAVGTKIADFLGDLKTAGSLVAGLSKGSYAAQTAFDFVSDRVKNMTGVMQTAQKIGSTIFDIGKMIAGKAATLAMAAAQHAAAAAQWVLNTAMSANPIALIIIGIAALIGIIILLVKNWDAVSAALGKAWEWIKGRKADTRMWP